MPFGSFIQPHNGVWWYAALNFSRLVVSKVSEVFSWFQQAKSFIGLLVRRSAVLLKVISKSRSLPYPCSDSGT